MTKLGIFMSHPIQYQIGLLQNIAKQPGIDLAVRFYWDFGVTERYDPEFNGFIKWDLPLLDGYNFRFLRNYALKKSTGFFGCINPAVCSSVFRREFDVVLIFGWALLSNWLLLITASLTRTPILLCAESPLSHEIYKDGFFGGLRKIVLRNMFSMVSGFLYIGTENRRFYESFGVPFEKMFFVPYAVDNKRHLQYQKYSGCREGRDKVVKILYVGKMIEKKRPMDLLRAFQNSQLTVGGIKTELWFVGSGNEQKELERYVTQHDVKGVTFWGFRNQTDLARFYAEADIFVLPSGLGETWGLVVNEAMCYGLPIIISDLVGCGPDLVTKKNGIVVPVGDIDRLAGALCSLIADKRRRCLFGDESLKIINGYSHEIAAVRLASAAVAVSAKMRLNRNG